MRSSVCMRMSKDVFVAQRMHMSKDVFVFAIVD